MSKVIDAPALQAWILANQREEGGVIIPPIEPPIPPVGELGSEGNPVPLIQPLPALYGYGYEKHYTNGEYSIPKGGNEVV